MKYRKVCCGFTHTHHERLLDTHTNVYLCEVIAPRLFLISDVKFPVYDDYEKTAGQPIKEPNKQNDVK